MSTWTELVTEFSAQPSDQAKQQWLNEQMALNLHSISALRADRNVLLYGSAFLQKPQAPPQYISMTGEDIDALMAVIHGMDWDKGLVLILHTPGGLTNAAESVVAYLRSKFAYIETVVPTFAMSAGTMVTLASDNIVMGRQSQLGPIDPQMPYAGRAISARAVVDQFDTAKLDILGDPDKQIPGDLQMAHVWAPVLSTIGPSLLQEARNALAYSERMVSQWLEAYMCRVESDPRAAGQRIASYFNDASEHLSHGRRIDRDECRQQGLLVDDLEDDQALQEAVLTLYHMMTIVFQNGATTKLLMSTTGSAWMKQWVSPEDQAAITARQQSTSRQASLNRPSRATPPTPRGRKRGR
jgi:hypothetical protein